MEDNLNSNYLSEREAARAAGRVLPPHGRPDSVFLAAIGENWLPGCREAVEAMVKYTNDQGHQIWWQDFPVERGRAFPEPGVVGVRDFAVNVGRNSKMEWIFQMDNDVKPKPDTLVRLMRWPVAIVGPYIWDDAENVMVGEPQLERGTGLQQAAWLCSSFFGIRANVMNCPGIQWRGTHNELEVWIQFANYAHYPFIDTGCEVKTVTPPSRTDALEFDERMEQDRDLYNNAIRSGIRKPV